MPERSVLTIGTAGHIDHGKTALVRALTGIDTDRLPQEKDRGITIDLGFAHLDADGVRVGIVDVPGHERFVRNMLAGASGIGAALLVVAADDSVMPQTREHLAILESLRIPRGVVAITKCDLAEDEWLGLVEQDVRELVRGTFLEGASIVRTSATTGAGVGKLRTLVTRFAHEHESDASGDVVRLPIDRSFVVQGIGTVVTGTLWSGVVEPGMSLEWMPGRTRVRVRSVQGHGEKVERALSGQRVALNLVDVHHTEVSRGQELVTPGALRPSRRLTVRIDALGDCPWPIKTRSRVRLHLGTAEVMAAVKLLDRDALEPGASGIAQLLCAEPVIARGRQALVLRAESPVVTIAGGVVLDPDAPTLKRPAREVLERLRRVDSDDGASAGAWLVGNRGVTPVDLVRNGGVHAGESERAFGALVESGELVGLGGGVTLHRDRLSELVARFEAWFERAHERAPLKASIGQDRVGRAFPRLAPDLLDGLLQHMVGDGSLVERRGGFGLASAGPRLSERQSMLLERFVALLEAGGFRPPLPADLARECGCSQSEIDEILRLAEALGEAVHIGGGVHVSPATEARTREAVMRHLEEAGKMTMAELRDLLGTTRKYAVPIGEYLDRIGLTKRRGDARVLARARTEAAHG